MMRWLRSSLPARAGLAVILIAVLALASSLSAGLIAWFSQGDAAAINTAGSVRMETYHLSWKLAAGATGEEIATITDSLQYRLNSQSLKAVLEDGPPTALQISYGQIQQYWNEDLRPALERGEPPSPPICRVRDAGVSRTIFRPERFPRSAPTI